MRDHLPSSQSNASLQKANRKIELSARHEIGLNVVEKIAYVTRKRGKEQIQTL